MKKIIILFWYIESVQNIRVFDVVFHSPYLHYVPLLSQSFHPCQFFLFLFFLFFFFVLSASSSLELGTDLSPIDCLFHCNCFTSQPPTSFCQLLFKQVKYWVANDILSVSLLCKFCNHLLPTLKLSTTQTTTRTVKNE